MKTKIKIWSAIGLLAGVFALIMGFVVIGADSMRAPGYMAFGADFYTEIYYASYNLANNIVNLINVLRLGLGSLLLFLGTVDVCFILSKITKKEISSQEGAQIEAQ